jgi:hypothetical protein
LQQRRRVKIQGKYLNRYTSWGEGPNETKHLTRKKRVGSYRSTSKHCRGETAVPGGVAQNAISKLVRGPKESNAVVGEH